jgi:hypothetical protein
MHAQQHNEASRADDGTIHYNPLRWAFFAEPSTYHAALTDQQWHLVMEAEF